MRAQKRGSPEGSFSLSAAWKKEIATSALAARRLGREGPAHRLSSLGWLHAKPWGKPGHSPPHPTTTQAALAFTAGRCAQRAAAWATRQLQVLRVCCHGDGPQGWWRGGSQSPKALRIQERETLEPQALQGSRLTTLLPKKPRCVPWGFSQTKEGRRSQGSPSFGKRLWKADLGTWAGEPLRAPRSREEAFPGTSLPGHCSVLHKEWADALWRVGPVAQWEEGKRA